MWSGAKTEFSIVRLLPLLAQPTKPPLWLQLEPSKLPSNLLLRMMTVPFMVATKPPLVASPLTLLLIVTDERQLSMLTVLPACISAMSPEAHFALVVMVPAVRRLRMVALPA